MRALEEEEGDALAHELGAELAKAAQDRAGRGACRDLGFPGPAPLDPHRRAFAHFRDRLNRLPEAQPVLEWAVNRLEDEAPEIYPAASKPIALCHRDFRTGNYLVEGGKLSGVLDSEFAGWSDPYEDLGWFCARCWRFRHGGAEAGGIGSAHCFLHGL